jgi:hypothetical protein
MRTSMRECAVGTAGDQAGRASRADANGKAAPPFGPDGNASSVGVALNRPPGLAAVPDRLVGMLGAVAVSRREWQRAQLDNGAGRMPDTFSFETSEVRVWSLR